MKKVFLIYGIIIGILIIAFIFVFTWRGDSKPIEAAADKFHAPSSWKLTRNRVIPPNLACLNGYACPSVERVWQVPIQQTYKQIIEFANSSSDVRFHNDSSCPENGKGDLSLCRLNGLDPTYTTYIEQYIGATDKKFYVSLTIEPRHDKTRR